MATVNSVGNALTGVTGTGEFVGSTGATLVTPASLGVQQSDLNMNAHAISGITDPTSPQEAATKNYVDSVAQGRVFKDPCTAGTVANFASTYNNGASGVGATLTATATGVYAPDGVTLALNDRVLVKDQTATEQNGIYVISTLGAVGVAAILTRAADMNVAAEFYGATTFIINGTVNAGRLFTETAVVTTVGTDPVTFVQSGDATSGIVNTGTANQLAYYAGSGNAISGLASAANGVLITSAGSVPSISSTLPSGIAATNMTLTTPVIAQINDANAVATLALATVGASAVNNVRMFNSLTGLPVRILASGTDADVGLNLESRGAGPVKLVTQNGTEPLVIQSGTGGAHLSRFVFADTSADRSYTFPDASGTIALTSGFGNFTFTGNTMSTSVTNGDINVIPNGTGNLTVGTTSNPFGASVFIAQPALQASLSLGAYTNNGGSSTLYLTKSRSTTIGSFVAVQSGDSIGSLACYADSGTNLTQAGSIVVKATGTISAGVVPSLMQFNTTDGSGALTQALTIDSSQVATFSNPIVSPGISFNTTTEIIGTTTNNNAAAGSVGEFVSSVIDNGTPVSLTTGTAANITSISLTAGDWDVWGTIGFINNSATSIQLLRGWVSTTSATLPNTPLFASQVYGASGVVFGTTYNFQFQTNTTRLSLSGTTTVYLSCDGFFTINTLSGFGAIYARRVR